MGLGLEQGLLAWLGLGLGLGLGLEQGLLADLEDELGHLVHRDLVRVRGRVRGEG